MNAFELTPRPPFRLVPTVRALQRLPGNRVDVLKDGRYCRVLATGDGPRLVVAADAGSIEQPLVRVAIAGGPLPVAAVAALRATLADMLGIAVDLTPFYDVAAEDPRLRAAATALRGLKPPRFPTLFETFVNTVVFQQISLAAAVAIVGRLVDRFGRPFEIEGERYFGFPEPAAIAAASAEELRSVGLMVRKAEVLRHFAGLVLAGALSFDTLRPLSSEEAIRVLTELPGVGRWTAEVLLLRGLGRLDVFPSGDAGVRRGLARLLGREQPLTAADEAPLLARFGAVRGCLYFYSLGWRLLQMGLIEAVP